MMKWKTMKIVWYESLFVGDKARKNRYRILQSVRNSRPIPGVYVITPSLNGNNILDIYPSAELCAPWHSEEEFFILGVAAGYQEALTVAGRIVAMLYRETGGFDMTGYLKQVYRKREE